MPRKQEMSWEDSPAHRWVKMFQGVRYRVTCQELGAKEQTKEGSARLANEWWERKLAELTGPTPLQRAVATLEPSTDAEVARLKADIERGQVARAILAAMPMRDATEAAQEITGVEADEGRHVEMLGQMEAKLGGEPVAADRTVGHHTQRFLTQEQLRAKKPGTFGDLASYIGTITKESGVLSESMAVDAIGERTVSDAYGWVRKMPWSGGVQKKVFGYFRRLVRYFWEEGLIARPRNLDSKTFDFDTALKAVKVYDIKDVREMLATLPKRLKLYAYLALNCGMYGVDMASLKRSEYVNGRIVRRRTKTERQKDVPTVDYLLWPETRELLDSYPPMHPEYVLSSKAGTPLLVRRMEGGKTVKVDLVGLQWHRGRGEKRANKPAITLKALRSVSATILESHPHYGRYKSHFLGHSPRSLADKHYAAPSKELFDEILTWLRGQIVG